MHFVKLYEESTYSAKELEGFMPIESQILLKKAQIQQVLQYLIKCITPAFESVVLGLAKAVDESVHLLEAVEDFFEALGAGDDDLAGDEDQEGHLGTLEAVDEAGEELGHELDLRGLDLAGDVVDLQLLEVDGELHVGGGNHVLYLEVGVAHREAHLFDYLGVLAACQLALLLRPRPRYHHLARTEDQPRRLRVAQPHDHCSEAVGVVLGRLALPSYLLQVQLASQVDSSDHILDARLTLFRHLQCLCFCPRAHGYIKMIIINQSSGHMLQMQKQFSAATASMFFLELKSPARTFLVQSILATALPLPGTTGFETVVFLKLSSYCVLVPSRSSRWKELLQLPVKTVLLSGEELIENLSKMQSFSNISQSLPFIPSCNTIVLTGFLALHMSHTLTVRKSRLTRYLVFLVKSAEEQQEIISVRKFFCPPVSFLKLMAVLSVIAEARMSQSLRVPLLVPQVKRLSELGCILLKVIFSLTSSIFSFLRRSATMKGFSEFQKLHRKV